jgi:polyhydroxyalkanoate synthesis repressor PhaR
MVKQGDDFVVFDAKTNEDITRSVLTQIIFEEEAKGQNLLPISFLRQLIRYYGDSLQSIVPDYLDMSMRSFTNNQDKMRDAMPEGLRENPLYQQFEEMGRQNLTMFSQAMQMFTPPTFGTGAKPAEPEPTETPQAPDATADMMKELKDQLTQMQERIDKLSDK